MNSSGHVAGVGGWLAPYGLVAITTAVAAFGWGLAGWLAATTCWLLWIWKRRRGTRIDGGGRWHVVAALIVFPGLVLSARVLLLDAHQFTVVSDEPVPVVEIVPTER